MNRQHIGIVFGGILLLVVAMGISRFAFTPILPFMRHDVGFSLEVVVFSFKQLYWLFHWRIMGRVHLLST